MKTILRRIGQVLAAAGMLLVGLVIAAALFWSVVSFIVAALLILAGITAVLFGLLFGVYVFWRRSRL